MVMVLNVQAVNGIQREIDISNDPIHFCINQNTSHDLVYGRAQVIPRKDQLVVRTISLRDQSAFLNVRKYDIDKKDDNDGGVVTGFIGGRTLKTLDRASNGKDDALVEWGEFEKQYKEALSKLYI